MNTASATACAICASEKLIAVAVSFFLEKYDEPARAFSNHARERDGMNGSSRTSPPLIF